VSKTTFRTKVKDIFKIPQINKVTKTERSKESLQIRLKWVNLESTSRHRQDQQVDKLAKPVG
jgi:hypothetical protein